MNKNDWIDAELGQLQQAGLRRLLRSVMTAPHGRVVIDGREVILLGSTNYLGLSVHPTVVLAAIEAMKVYGTGSSGSRLMTGNCQLYDGLESKIADVTCTEAALVFSSGYLANIGTIPALMGPALMGQEHSLILSDERNHISIIEGCRLSRAEKRIYRHGDLDHLAELLNESADFSRKLIVTDGVFSMDGDLAPLPGIYELATAHNAMVLIDDVHGFGVLGESGGGTVEHFGLQNRGIIQLGSLSKAIGGVGAFVAGERRLIDLLLNKARGFIFTTGLPPATLAGASAAIDVMQETPELRHGLMANAQYLKSALLDAGFQLLPSETQIIPLLLGDPEVASRFSHVLFEHGVYAPAIRPPTIPEGTSRLRLSVMGTHTDEDLNTAVKAFVLSKKAVS